MKLQRSTCALLLALACCGCARVVKPAGDMVAIEPLEQAPRLVAYKSTRTRTLNLHVFSPDENGFDGARPAIVFFHGGGWVEGDAQRFYDQSRHLAVLGMVAISADYRIKSKDGTEPKVALADAISAMRFVRANARAFRIDTERIAAGGGSAGAQLAAALATSKGFEDPEDAHKLPYRPSALVLFNPVIDNGPNGYGHDWVRKYWKEFSPLHNIRRGHPPTIIISGTKDNLIPAETAELYCEKAREVGSKCILQLYEGQPHGFFNRRRSPFYYEKSLQAIVGFLHACGYLP